MVNFKKQYKDFFNCYKKRLNMLNKESFNNLNNPMDYFITYLKFMRDYYILTEPLETDGHENIKIAIIASAVSSYEQYKTCITKYFKVAENGTVEKISDAPIEEVTEKYNKERIFHWSVFWNLVSLNMESWMSPNATI